MISFAFNVSGFSPSEPEPSTEALPSAGEEQAAPSGAAGEMEKTQADEAEVEEAHAGEEDEAAGEPEPTENGEKAEGPAEEKPEEGTEKKEWVSPESKTATLNTAIFHFDSTFIHLCYPYLCWMTADCSPHGRSVAFLKETSCHCHAWTDSVVEEDRRRGSENKTATFLFLQTQNNSVN